MNSFIPDLSKEQVDAEIALMREQGKKMRESKEETIAFLIRAGLFTKNGHPKKWFHGGKSPASNP